LIHHLYVNDAIVVSLTGWLLAYPAVYVHTHPDQPNGLGSEPLILLRAQAHSPFGTHLLQSFSLPACVMSDAVCDTFFAHWQTEWQTRFASQTIWTNLHTTRQYLTLSHVVL
jgi:hypothetical protein